MKNTPFAGKYSPKIVNGKIHWEKDHVNGQWVHISSIYAMVEKYKKLKRVAVRFEGGYIPIDQYWPVARRADRAEGRLEDMALVFKAIDNLANDKRAGIVDEDLCYDYD